MGYFDNCRPDERFTISAKFYDNCVVNDWDQRRCITVKTSWAEQDDEWIIEALARHADDIPAEAVRIEVSEEGELLSHSSDVERDRAMVPFYPSVNEFPLGVRKIRRSDLIEVSRMGIQVDLVTHEPSMGEARQLAFKYYINQPQVPVFWHELNCVLRIPKHPNVVPFDSLVVDVLDGEEKVVGFTTTFVDGGTVEDRKDRVFKLKHIEQLFAVIDHLNLTLGIVHGDVCPWNLLVDRETDALQIFDFNMASKLGWEGDPSELAACAFAYDKHRNDIKLAIFTVYEIITRDLHFREENYPHELEIPMVLEKIWEKHPEVRLDAEVSKYRLLAENWLAKRRDVDKEITHFSQVPGALDWPCLPPLPIVPFVGTMQRRTARMRQEMIMEGADFLKWQRPSSRDLPLPHGRRLLATGQVVQCGDADRDHGGRQTLGVES
ncbi:Shaggy-related protein kinase theta [Diaporthe amygdali]|uniref:Shaggy-related protein kinase theta n=1 Tax=Phomopsis amygdali TaxID=1214568 RepID=UPI0022FF04E0|nr:Shaggy-related protein kinase theta [Diaporthe amygdali]KAJ0117578.1 Shaggy-related protein kinase theta [Diaporthe amygdali]